MTTVTTNHAFNAFSRHVEQTREWLSQRCDAAVGFSSAELLDRLAQYVVDRGLPSFAQAVQTRRAAGEAPMPPEGTVLVCGAATMTVGSGALSIARSNVLRLSVDFVVHWAYVLVAIVAGAVTARPLDAAVLVHDLSDSDTRVEGIDAAFVAFCRQGPITPLVNARRLFVSGTEGPSTDPSLIYCRYPLVSLVREGRRGVIGRSLLALRHLALLVTYPLAVVRTPMLAVLGRELAYSAVARELDRQGAIDAIVHTCSSYRHQPVWARGLGRARTHMVWYAQNWRPLRKVEGDEASHFPTTRWIRADEHWVWTESFATFLREVLTGTMHVVGPILFRLPSRLPPDPSRFVVLVFDVPAVSDAIMIDPNGEIDNYFHPDRLCAFLRDIVSLKAPLEARLGRAVTIRLKMKRGYQPDYAREYYTFVDDLVARGEIELAEPRDNLFELVSTGTLAISYPFTSAAYVAEAMQIPSIYYDATGLMVSQDFSARGCVAFARRPAELAEALVQGLSPLALSAGGAGVGP